MRRLLALIEEEFQKRLAQKTGWGRNEVMVAYKEAQTAAMLRLVEENLNESA